MTLDPDVCYRALSARDGRFDGLFFVCVSTTGIYCRPICTARLPRRDRCSFVASTAVAERDGFRACLRCRPELAPGAAPLDSVSRLVAEAVRRIEAGALNATSVDALATTLGVTGRHLRRVMRAELGVTPLELAQTRRLAMAKQLLHDTALPMTEIAYASGWRSLRRFNASFRQSFQRTPIELRTVRTTPTGPGAATHGKSATLCVSLGYRAPYNWQVLVNFLAARSIPGVESVVDGTYTRTVQVEQHRGFVRVAAVEARQQLRVEVSPSLRDVLMAVVTRLKTLFDLDARPDVIATHLGRDKRMRPLLRARPGLRVPGAFEGWEMAVRAVLGQQVSVKAATTLAGRLVTRFGEPLETPFPQLSRVFPRPEVLAHASEGDLTALGILATRGRTLIALAQAVCRTPELLSPTTPPDQALPQLLQLPGVGEWTAQYIAMRALHWPDAFVAGDLVIRNALGGVSTREAERMAEAYRPWRAYAALHLWNSTPEKQR